MEIENESVGSKTLLCVAGCLQNAKVMGWVSGGQLSNEFIDCFYHVKIVF